MIAQAATATPGVQVPLSLRFQDREFFDNISKRLGVSQTGAGICLALARNPDDWTSYSRRKNHYVRPQRYRDRLYSYCKVVPQIDLLARNGLILHAKQEPGGRGWQSAVQPTVELIEAVRAATAGSLPKPIAPSELIWLRDECGMLIDYPDRRERDRMRKRTAEINEMIITAEIDGAETAPLVRIFNQRFDRGGRFYAMGKSWQNIKKDMRSQIRIGGEPVVELDFKTLHPALLYARVGVAMPDDCYAIANWPRDLVKTGLLVLINSRNFHSARMCMAHHTHMGLLHVPGGPEADAAAGRLIADIKKVHAPISRYFHSDIGAELMHEDSQIAQSVMLLLARRGVVVLPVHDSFMVPARARENLHEIMLQAAFEVAKLHAKVEQKTWDEQKDTPTTLHM